MVNMVKFGLKASEFLLMSEYVIKPRLQFLKVSKSLYIRN